MKSVNEITTCLHKAIAILGTEHQLYEFQIMFGILAITWVVYSVILLLLNANTKDRLTYVVTGKLLNAGFFTFLGLYEIDRVSSVLINTWDEKFWFLVFLAGILSISKTK